MRTSPLEQFTDAEFVADMSLRQFSFSEFMNDWMYPLKMAEGPLVASDKTLGSETRI